MKVICAGLGKTGTTSLKRALQELGYNTYHYKEHVTFHRQQWLNSFETDRIPDFVHMYKGVDAITDLPPAFWFEEISAAFPDAKVILSVRDSEEKWVQSFVNHLRLADTVPFYVRIYSYIRGKQHFENTLHDVVYGSYNPNATALYRKRYRQHNERVQAVIPREKLFIFNVKQGWEPLCKFLCCDVPSIPFPNVNVESSETKKRMLEFARQARVCWFCVLFVAIVDEEYIEELKDKSENENTRKSTEYWKNVFKKWANERNFQANLEEYESDVLDQTLSQFYAELRKENGDDYERLILPSFNQQ